MTACEIRAIHKILRNGGLVVMINPTLEFYTCGNVSKESFLKLPTSRKERQF